MDALIGKEAFVGIDQCTWLYSGAETPAYVGGIEAIQKYVENRSLGPKGRERNSRTEEQLRVNLSKLMGGAPGDIALLSNASEAITTVIGSLDLQPGDNVVVNQLEYPSSVLPFILLKEKGIDMRVVPHTDWRVTPEDMMAQTDERTRLVIVSHVSYLSGARFDYRTLYNHLKQTGALMLLDATQSLGAFPVDLKHTDFLVSSSYKWLLSFHGLGILGMNPSRTAGLLPRTAGWRSVSDLFSERRFEELKFLDDARKFELGFPSYPSIYPMRASTERLLEIGVDRIERHILDLGSELMAGLRTLGYELMTPDPEQERAGNISVICPEGDRIASRLEELGVLVWGGDSRLRASVHLFNDSSDVEKLLAMLPEAAKREG